MKFFALAIALMVSASAQARSPIYTQTETLNTVVIDGQKTNLTGVLQMNFVESTIEVDIYEDPCGQFQPSEPGTFRCMAAARLVETLRVPMQSRGTSCGSKVYSGVRDLTPADGLYTEITVADHNTRICEDYRPHAIEVQAKTIALRSRKTTTYYLAK